MISIRGNNLAGGKKLAQHWQKLSPDYLSLVLQSVLILQTTGFGLSQEAVICVSYVFSPCLHGFPPGALVSPQSKDMHHMYCRCARVCPSTGIA